MKLEKAIDFSFIYDLVIDPVVLIKLTLPKWRAKSIS